MKELEERVLQLQMSTNYLVHDLLKEGKKYKNYLENILAVVHRDGGHYTAEHGIEKSVKDAMLIISNAIVK